jgi:succinyl-diaminopimelate desuccinylase
MINPAEQNLLEHIDKDELINLTRDLVKIDSVIRPETGNTEHHVVEFIRTWIENELKGSLEEIKAVTSEVVEVEPGRENIVVTIDSGRTGPCLLLEGHTDVVSEGNRDSWHYGPFSGHIEEGKLYGRGSCDMKGGLAVNLITAKALLCSGARFNGKLKLAIVCDEEDMMIGIKDFIRRGYADDVDAALVSEPEENQLCLSMKGAIRAVVRVKGKMAHGAMPLTGINPSPRMARIILAYQRFEKEEIERCGKDPYLGYPSITFTVVQAPPPGEPKQLNVMPSDAVGYIDIRTTPKQDHETIRTRLKQILEELAVEDSDFHAEIDFIEDRPVVYMDKTEPIVQTAEEAYRDVTGREPVYSGVPGATDGTFLRAWKGVPSLVNGPGPKFMPHQTDEYIETDQLYEAARIYLLTAVRFLQ